MKNIYITFILLLAALTLAAQSNYSPCYTNNMSKGNTAFSQGKYSEARTYYVNAKQCAGGNPTEAQKKINACDAKIKAQKEAAEAKRRAEAEAEEAKRKAEEEEAAIIARGYQEITVNGVTFKMIYVQGGTFTMGCTSEQENCSGNEKTSHTVTVNGFWMGETEVTQALWKAVMGANPSSNKGENLPVEQVSWNDCQEFIRKLNVFTGKTFCLPTEAEWEYAARGGNKSQQYKYAGSKTIDEVAWYNDNSGYKTHPVKTKSPNELGLYDMSGNVWEWCSDWYGEYSSFAQTDPKGSSSGSSRVLRGGSWDFKAEHCRVSKRDYYTPVIRLNNRGFRLALVPAQKKSNACDAKINPTPPSKSKSDASSSTMKNNKEFILNGIAFKMIYVQGGTFTMGCTSEQGGDCDSGEKPIHSVTLSDFLIGETEVIQALWEAVMGTTVREQRVKADPSSPMRGEGASYPMYYVSWNEAVEFCDKLNEKFRGQLPSGYRFALPTEAQWEYAARGGNKSQHYKYAGSNNIDNVSWCSTNTNDKGTNPVKMKIPNELGLYDMSGNVFEWCQDWYGDYSSFAQTNPTGPSSGSDRVLRSGGWNFSARCCRVTYRYNRTPDYRASSSGFRLVLVHQ